MSNKVISTFVIGSCLTHTEWAQMIFTVSEIYFEAVRQDTTPEHLDVKLQLSVYFTT
jgi:hypothetical protein